MGEKSATTGPIVWMDLEMTGLDPDVDEIIEIATIVTDVDLNIVAEGPELVIHQPPERFDKMDDWNRDHHTKSGLWQRVLASTVSTAEAETKTLEFIKQHVKQGQAPLAGNSIWQDRRFLYRYMKSLDAYLHYRMIDVSTIKELRARWYQNTNPYEKGESEHRALADIRESIAELRYYRQEIFIPGTNPS